MKKIKFSNISTKGNETQNQPSKSKRKILKAFGFGSLAVMMAVAGTFAFAPLGATPSVASASEMSTQASESLVIPKKDDPVIFTTESGIEIKWGNAASATGGGKESASYSYSSYTSGVGLPSKTINQNLTSGGLNGFPYFTTSKNGTTYTWVIIGRNSDVSTMKTGQTISGSQSSAKIEYKTLSEWKSKINSSDTYANMIDGYSPTYKTFFNNTYENTTPAGIAINSSGVLNQTTARDYSASLTYSYPQLFSISSVKTSTEIPSGCILALSNASVGTSAYYSSAVTCTSAAHTFAGDSNTLRATCANYYTNDTFGFGTLKSSLQNTTLKQICIYNTNSSSSSTVSRTKTKATTNLYFFPLDCAYVYNKDTKAYYTQAEYDEYLSYSNFKVETYLTQTQRALADYVQGRSMPHHWHPFKINASGTITETPNRDANTAELVRPACVLKIT